MTRALRRTCLGRAGQVGPDCQPDAPGIVGTAFVLAPILEYPRVSLIPTEPDQELHDSSSWSMFEVSPANHCLQLTAFQHGMFAL